MRHCVVMCQPFCKMKKKIDSCKLKTSADSKSNIGTNELKLFDREENIVGKGENAG